jgi:hypothetical protein
MSFEAFMSAQGLTGGATPKNVTAADAEKTIEDYKASESELKAKNSVSKKRKPVPVDDPFEDTEESPQKKPRVPQSAICSLLIFLFA